MKVLPHTRSCFVCGESNPVGLKLLFHSDGRAVHARFTPSPELIGFKGVVHGGIIATLLDEIMVWACAVQSKRFTFCAEMNVRFLKPVRPDEEVTATGELVINKRRLLEAKAELKNAAGEILATATGKYIPVPDSELTAMAEDFVDDPRGTFD